MESADGSTDIVHPEVRAHINSLVSALGGVSADDDGRYQLGDDALEVLRDLKRWIRFYDEKTNRMDVSRCIYEANLIEGDLLPILATWPDNANDSKFKSRIALACFEVLVPLTWPMDRDKERMTVNHHRHMPVLELAQVAYKRAVINFDGARILHTAVRAALPSIAMPIGERTQRDQGIIKLMLFFLRNISAIAPPPDVKYDGDESQISRSATIDAFSYQDIFHVLLTLASNMGEDFRTEDTVVMEVIYHLVKRVNIENMFMNEKQLHRAKADELSELMQKEKAMLNSYHRPTRHNRFGTMIWVKREDGKMSTLLGQDALVDAAARARKMDSTKTFKPARRGKKENKVDREIGPAAKLNARANGQLRSFVEDFLDSGFNPLFSHVRKTIDREAPHLLQYHRRQFFYLVAWFLEAERTRRKSTGDGQRKADEGLTSFNLVAGVLNQEMFITLSKALHEAHEHKDWPELTAVMRCFTQILITVQEMMQCGNDDDEEIAENILSRLFYEEATHDAIANIGRTYKDQGFDYLDAATELVHHFLHVLKSYSQQNADMQVRSRKRARRKKKAANGILGDEGAGTGAEANDGSEEEDDADAAERTVRERKFDFSRFSARFAPQGVVDTFVAFTKFYRDLTDAQLKRCHRYFYRMAFKQDMGVMLYRVDIIHLLYNMIKGPEALEKSSGAFKEWEELVKQILRKLFKKLEERPELLIEMLFSKLQGTAFFLEYGYEKQTSTVKAKSKPGVELEFRHTEARDRQIAIVVGALLDKNQPNLVDWVKKIVTNAESERRSWAVAAEVRAAEGSLFDEDEPDRPSAQAPPIFYISADDEAIRTSMFKNSHLRLLMAIAGFERLGPTAEESIESSWIIPSDVTADHLKDTLHFINQAEFSPPTFEEGVLAEHQLKRKNVTRRKAAYDDDDDGDGDDGLDDEILFPAGGPPTRKVIDASDKPKKHRRQRKPRDELDDAALDERARKRREREREKARKIKSALYVKEGDDDFDSEEDEAFFAREREIRARAEKAAQSAIGTTDAIATKSPTKKRKTTLISDDSDGDDEDEDDDDLSFARKILSNHSDDDDDDDDDAESRTDDTPVDLSDGESRKRRRMSLGHVSDDDIEGAARTDASDVEMVMGEKDTVPAKGDQSEDDDVPVVPTRRPRIRGGFILDSDDDE